VAVAPGDGLVVRTGNVVMYIADGSLAAGPLITAVESVADAEQPGGAVVERLAALAFGADSASVPPFGVVAPTTNGLLLLLRGAVIASIDDGARELSGARALTWVDEVLPASAQKVTIGQRLGLVAPPRSDLRAGVVPGAGFVLEPWGTAAERSAEPATAPAQPATAEFTVATQTSATRTMSPPVPPRTAPTETSTLAPVAGVLQTEDGAVYPLDRPYVIGRDPLGEDSVRNAHASPIVVQNDQHVSRVHAFVTVNNGAVYVRDASTPGGTYIAAPGAKTWTEISSTPTELGPGWSLRVGERILTYRGA
jgi:hypothetical protein